MTIVSYSLKSVRGVFKVLLTSCNITKSNTHPMQMGLTFKLPPVIEAFKIIHGCNGISKRPTGSKNFLQYKLFENKQPFCNKH